MARRETTYVVQDEGRDLGKMFLLREMPAVQAEEWFARTMMLLARSGAEVPSDIFSRDAAGFAAMGLGAVLTGLSKTSWNEVKPLFDEMLTCVVSYQQAKGSSPVPIMSSELLKGQVEEVSTLMKLREAILSLHLGFSIRERLSRFRDEARSLTAENP